MTLKFTVPGPPKALSRARKGQYGSIYTTREDLAYQNELWACALKAGARQRMFGGRPLWLGLWVYVKKPKHPTWPWPTTRPDLDNFTKQAMDGLGPAVADDAQIVGYLSGSGKYYGEPRLEVHLTDECPSYITTKGENG